MSKRSAHGTHVWVRTDLIEAILHHQGTLPSGWKPTPTLTRRHGSTSVTDWGWARAQISGATSPDSNSSSKNNGNRNSNNPFGSVKLKKTTREITETGEESSDEGPKLVTASIVIDDEEFAPPHLLYAPVSLTYDAKDTSLVCMANPWWFAAAGGDHESKPPEDLTNLSHLHEPAVVFCLQRRYEQDSIYTYTGKVLLALNPFRPVTNVYGEDVMHKYWNMGFGQRPPPHVYAIAEDAYRSLVRSLLQHCSDPHNYKKGQDQSILVSGESGAGKTVTTKIVMQYLATLSQNSDPSALETGRGGTTTTNNNSIEAQVLQSNPILESFGNARTVRNDNSSRFGKFIEIEFNSSGSLVSASITTYLLEKVRLITQTPGERNYHIFYELLAGVSQRERQQLRIGNMSAYDFKMTAASGTFDRRDGVADRDTFKSLKEALDTVGFTSDEQFEMFKVCAALLHASNLTFQESNDASELDLSNSSLRCAVDLLGVSVIGLNEACCRFAIEARGETLYKNLTMQQAQKAIEALIKATYQALFTYIAHRINSFITVIDGKRQGKSAATASIGVLDIFGFESFEENSFEQLCINFCNEALQQQFNKFVFKQEQDEYKREGIEWSFISFPDNQDVLDLIEKKRDGIISILDEQCRLQRCTDSSFARALYEKCSGHSRFFASKSQQVNLTFSIQHYAGLVEYSSTNFLEKNKDELPKETTELLLSSSHDFIAKIAKILSESTGGSKPDSKTSGAPKRTAPRSASKRDNSSSMLRESVGGQFTSQLRDLRSRISDTAPHYIRCLKPNDDLIPYNFQPLVIADQLRCAGVLEAIRVSRVGFPHRYSHQVFVDLYSVLCRSDIDKHRHDCNANQLCEILVHQLIPPLRRLLGNDENRSTKAGSNAPFLGLQMGRSKVFIRPKTFEALDLLRGQKVEKAAIAIQATARMFLCSMHYEISQIATIIIQTAIRRFCAIRRAWRIRINRRAATIQSVWRTYSARRRFYAVLIITSFCQSAYRGAIARNQCHRVLLDRRAAIIQRGWKRTRIYSGKMSFYALRSATIALQTAHRRKAALRVLKRLRVEAKDLHCIAKERDQFREETRRLKEELERARSAAGGSDADDEGRSYKENEVKQLKMEVKQLKMELEKAKHLPLSPTLSHADELGFLARECDLKERQLRGLRKDLKHQYGLNMDMSNDSMGELGRSFSNDRSFQENVEPNQSTISGRSPARRSPDPSTSFSLLDEDNPDEVYLDRSFEAVSNPQDEIGSKSSKAHTNSTLSLSYSMNTPHLRGETFFKELRRLHDSIHSSDLGLLEEILRQSSEEAHVLINEGDEIGRTALHVSVLSSNLLMTQTLLDKAAVANAQDNDGETPLHLAETASMTSLLVKQGRANPNIPNIDGICSLHLAVQRRDLDSVRTLLLHNANVNSADNVRWFTPLHLVALPPRAGVTDNGEIRARICELMASGASSRYEPDLNYQDSEGNCPLHYAVQLVTADAYDLVKVFIESGADPKVLNNRKQSALHLLCHNNSLRQFDFYPSLLQMILGSGGDPNQQSAAGCTPLHLSLYHRDIDSAVELVASGAQLHPIWKKPKRWVAFWDDKGSSSVLALDMVKKDRHCSRILAAITVPQKWAPSRSWCMQCKTTLGAFARALHCGHCGRFVCGDCSTGTLGPEFFPFGVEQPTYVCVLCEKLLTARAAFASTGTWPTTNAKAPDENSSTHLTSSSTNGVLSEGLSEF